MPNHVRNIIRCVGDETLIKNMLASVQNDEFGVGTIDFNKVIPMPKSLNIEESSRTDKGLEAYRAFVKFMKEDALSILPNLDEENYLAEHPNITSEEWKLGKTAWQNLQQYGAKTWYDWCVENWGTKWNGYGFEDPDFCEPSSLVYEWADEDYGYNCGRITYADGHVQDVYYPESFKDGLELACSVWNDSPEDAGYVLNKTRDDYVYVDGKEFESVEILGQKALFANDRLTDYDIPQGLFCYYLRKSDDGERFAAIEPKVFVNLGGTIVTSEPFDFGEKGYIELDDSTEPNFIGETMTFGKFMCNIKED